MKFKDIESARKRYNQLVTAMQAIVGGEGDNMTAEQKTTFDAFKNEAEQILGDHPKANLPDGILSKPDNGQGNYTEPARPKTPTRYFKDSQTAFDFGCFLLGIAGNQAARNYSQQIGLYNATQLSGTNSLGGYLVPVQFEKTIIDLRNQYGVFRRNSRAVAMTTDQTKIPRRKTGLTGYFVGEGSSITTSTKTWDQVSLSAKKLAVLTKFSRELSEDAIIPLGDDLVNEIAYSMAYTEDLAGFNGDSTSTYAGITGVSPALKAAAGTPTTTSAGGVVIAAGNTFAEITLSNFFSVLGVCPAYALPNAKWYCSSMFYAAVMLRLAYAAGGVNGNEILSGPGSRGFLGYPVELSEVMPTTDANSQIACLFGDLSKASTFGDRSGIAVDYSIDATIDSDNLFEKDLAAVRGIQRFDIVVHDVGSTSAAGPIVGLQSLNS